MESVQVFNVVRDPKERARYSHIQVLQSAAGYYLGTIYTAPEGYQEPGSRDSCYFANKADAEWCLEYLNKLHHQMIARYSPEDIVATWAQQIYTFGKDPGHVGYRYMP